MTLQKINLNIEYYNKLFSDLLKKNELIADDLETAYGIFDDNDELAACGGRSGNVLKCFAVDSKFKGMDLTSEILSALLKDAYAAKYKSLFIFTKKDSKIFFINSGFECLASAENSILLYKGEKQPEDILNGMLKTCPYDFSGMKNAAIVINANPFTLGHRYLVEEALKFCDNEKKLYIFVVQADKSFFSFKDRFFLVKENTKDLKNTIVLPSTDFLISSATFPSYFLKEKKLIQKNQAQLDAQMFLKYFVPLFNIDTRFLGDEPLDKSTAIYNETLLSLLPPVCNVKIIPRKKTENKDEHIISATAVRQAFKNKDLNSIKDFISPITYNFLKNKI